MGFLLWLENSPVSVWVHESPSVWAQPTVMTLHTMGMGVLVGASWMLDLRLLGINKNMPLSSYRWVFRAVAISLTVNVVTGLLLFAQKATTWATAFPFLVKMLLVVVSVATLIPLRKYVFSATGHQDIDSRMRVLAVVSIVAWAGAITAGRLLAYLVA
jgi:hypothetical protein